MTLLKKAIGTRRAVIPSVGTYNGIVDHLNRGGIRPTQTIRERNGLCICIVNIGGHSIPAGAPVAFNNQETESWPTHDTLIVPGRWYADLPSEWFANRPPWGIAQEVIPPGSCGTVLLSGHAVVSLPYVYSTNVLPEYIAPTYSGEYEFANSGTCRVLASDGVRILCALNVGGSGGNVTEYKGGFRLEFTSTGILNMISGTVHIGLGRMSVKGYYPAIVAGTHYCKLVVVWGGPSSPNSWSYRWEDNNQETMSYLEWQKVLAWYRVADNNGSLYVAEISQMWYGGSLVLSGRVV